MTAVARSAVSIAVTTPGALVRVTGDIDAAVVPALRSRLDDAVALRPYVIMDLSAAGTIESEGLCTLVHARNAARRHGGEVLLAAPSRYIQTVLWSMRLHTAFRMFESVPQAIAAVLAEPRPPEPGQAGAIRSL